MKAYIPVLAFMGLAAVGFVGMRDRVDDQAAEAEPAVETKADRAAPSPVGARMASLKKSDDGHYWANASVNGSSVRFLVDTGATVVALTENDARRAGINVARLPSTVRISTANGEVHAGVAMLDRVKISGVELRNVEAVVLKDLETSLLGMSFLGRLKSWQMTPGAMVLKQ